MDEDTAKPIDFEYGAVACHQIDAEQKQVTRMLQQGADEWRRCVTMSAVPNCNDSIPPPRTVLNTLSRGTLSSAPPINTAHHA